MATSSPTTSPGTYQRMLGMIAKNFCDPSDIVRCYSMVYPDREIDDPDIVGITYSLEDLVISNVESYADQVLLNKSSPYYLLKDMCPFIEKYLRTFDVIAYGPDLMKYTLAFGMGLDNYTQDRGERAIVSKIVRLQTIRRLRAVAGLARADLVPPPAVMARKIFKVWNDDKREDLLGHYGTYMTFKTWSLG